MSGKSVTSKKVWISAIFAVILVPAVILLSDRMGDRNYYIAGVLIIILAMIPFFAGFESCRPEARELVTIAVMCAIAVASRIVFIMLPGFKPVVAIIMITGMAFGPSAGFLTGAMGAFVSNFVFGQGPWTPWQMFAFGIAGFIFGLLSGKGPVKAEAGLPSGFSGGRSLKKILQRLPVSLFGFLVIVVIVGPILDTCTLFTMTTAVSGASAATVYLAGLPVNLIHGAAVFVTLFFLTVPIMDKLDRIKIKYGMMEKQDKVR
ncbi:MAG: ECF transporter S component [Clostridiales bacterium]|nr:ECF transporter S component [Clostridiales bacterium]